MIEYILIGIALGVGIILSPLVLYALWWLVIIAACALIAVVGVLALPFLIVYHYRDKLIAPRMEAKQ